MFFWHILRCSCRTHDAFKLIVDDWIIIIHCVFFQLHFPNGSQNNEDRKTYESETLQSQRSRFAEMMLMARGNQKLLLEFYEMINSMANDNCVFDIAFRLLFTIRIVFTTPQRLDDKWQSTPFADVICETNTHWNRCIRENISFLRWNINFHLTIDVRPTGNDKMSFKMLLMRIESISKHNSSVELQKKLRNRINHLVLQTLRKDVSRPSGDSNLFCASQSPIHRSIFDLSIEKRPIPANFGYAINVHDGPFASDVI